MYDGYDDVSQIFIHDGIVATGWDDLSAPDLHEYFREINLGDIVHIKFCSYSSNITVKAIGIITDEQILTAAHGHPQIEIGQNVRWIYTVPFVINRPVNQKNNVRANTIYQEFHPDIVSSIMTIVNKSILNALQNF